MALTWIAIASLAVGPLMGIALLAEKYGSLWSLLYIPLFLFTSLGDPRLPKPKTKPIRDKDH